MNVGFVSLGCSKNLVVTEEVIGLFKKHNFNIVNNEKDADIIIINTCGFIESAKQEAIDTILEMAQYKDERCKYLVVMGCMVERYKEEMIKALPEVDLFIKVKEYNNLWKIISQLLKLDTSNDCMKWADRVITTGDYYAYLKIADGCSNRCTYCAIPYIRGKQVSRSMEDIIGEAKKLAKKGYREIILIAQDTSKYGIDIYKKPMLAELLKELSKIQDIEWIRFLYAYPETIDDDLIKVVKEEKKICNYFDIPIQHISDSVLKRMNRRSTSASIKSLIKRLRKQIPDVVIRTTVMVGFPGETEEDFKQLYDFIKEAKFDKLGCFSYSKEDGTPAVKLKPQIHHMTKKSRYNKIMSLQQSISRENMQKYIGKTLTVLVEGKTIDNTYYIGRSYMDVPEIDGVVYIKNEGQNLLPGHFANVQVVKVKDYDLICK